MGMETCHRSRSEAATWSRWGAFSLLIKLLSMLTFLFFGISTVKVRSGSSPWRKQLREWHESWRRSRDSTPVQLCSWPSTPICVRQASMVYSDTHAFVRLSSINLKHPFLPAPCGSACVCWFWQDGIWTNLCSEYRDRDNNLKSFESHYLKDSNVLMDNRWISMNTRWVAVLGDGGVDKTASVQVEI